MSVDHRPSNVPTVIDHPYNSDFGLSTLDRMRSIQPVSFKLIAGLGNPGRQYELTRHNIGFMLLDRMATAEGTEFKEITRWQSELAKLQDGSWLIKPQTFMNLSGRALQQVMNFYKLEPREILVIYDDASLPLGTLRFREKGSAGGHNGIKSIIAQISTQEFPRLKIGIGGSGPADMSSHVLGKFSEEEGPMLENTLARALDAVQLARTKGISEASNKFHQKPAPEPQAEKPDDETDEDSPGSERII